MLKLFKKISILLVILIFTSIAYSKRTAPKPVEPIIYKGIKYEAIHWGKSRGLGQNGGYIEAFSAKTGKSLWVLKVYSIKYGKFAGDAYDNFIRSMKVDNGYLIIDNERGGKYKVNLSTKEVSKVN